MKKLTLILIAFLSACATTSSKPIEIRDNVFVMSRKEGAFPLGMEPLLQEVIEESKEFCAKKSLNSNIIDMEEADGPFIWGNYPKATITFSCIE